MPSSPKKTYLIGNTAKQISTVGAGFYVDSTLANATNCVSATFGPCSVSSHCAPLAAAPALATRDAGEISIRGGISPIVLTPTAEGAYRTVSDGSSSLWSGGESLTITAGGGTVPAFATTIVAPPALVISSPTNATRGLAIDRNTDWTIAWNPAAVGNVTLVLQLKNQGLSIQCKFPASAGAGTISREALQASSSGAVGVVALALGNTQQLSVGDWNVDVSANAPVTQDGRLANIIPVTLR